MIVRLKNNVYKNRQVSIQEFVPYVYLYTSEVGAELRRIIILCLKHRKMNQSYLLNYIILHILYISYLLFFIDLLIPSY